MKNQDTRRDFIKKGIGATAGITLLPGHLISNTYHPSTALRIGAITTKDIVKWMEELQGRELGHEEGIHHGTGDDEIKGITVCWKTSPQAIAEAGERGDNLIIGHETLHYPYYSDFDPDRTKGWREWKINTQRMERLNKNKQTFLRLHQSLDRLYIAEDMAKWMELGEPVGGSGYSKVYEIAECTLEELVEKVKKLSGMPALRVSAPKGLKAKVKRVSLLIGGAALVPNGGAFEPGLRENIDAFIGGETDNYGFRYASEMGVSLIETSHEVCENPGIERFVKVLQESFPDLRVTYYENKLAYKVM